MQAQEWELGAGIGVSGYMGEYNQDKIYKFNSIAGSIGAKYNFNPTWGVRAGFAVVRINGKANYFIEPGLPVISRNEIFESRTINEFSILAEFNFFRFEPNRTTSAYTPYLFVGIGGRIDTISSTSTARRREVIRAVAPFGVGFKYNLKGSLSLDAQLAYRLTADNNLDGVPGPSAKRTFVEKLHATDTYMSLQFGITYTLFKQDCPTW